MTAAAIHSALTPIPARDRNSEMSASAASQGRPMSDHLLTARNLEEGSIFRQPKPAVRILVGFAGAIVVSKCNERS